MMNKIRTLSVLLVFFLTFVFVTEVHAQSQTTEPIYIVQPGDTLNDIAGRFGVSVNDLINANNLPDPNNISTGLRLVIPGLDGVTGILTTQVISLGENLDTLTRQYQIKPSIFIRLNRITSPAELYAGASLIIPQENETPSKANFSKLSNSQTLLEFAALQNVNPWQVLLLNQTNSLSEISSEDHLLVSMNSSSAGSSLVSPSIKLINVSPLPIIQGTTVEIKLTTFSPMKLSGSLNGQNLNFFQQPDGSYIALQGIHAMSPIGLTEFSLSGDDQNGPLFSFNQMLLLESGNFGKESDTVDPETLDPAITKPEDDLLQSIVSKISMMQLWEGKWQYPLDEPACITSGFGNRRSFNGSDYIYFHSGLDFGVCVVQSLNIYATASGVVVFAGPLTIRGNATIIDHGQGVFSAYYHQSEIKVKVGDTVSKGQLIGLIGDTGRVTGPHLHFEVWVNNIQVQPLDWLENVYP